MKILSLVLLFIFLVSSQAFASTVYTANEEGMTISVVDTEKAIAQKVDIPAMPHNVDITRDGKTLLATGMAHDHTAGKLLVFNVSDSTPKLVRQINLGKHLAHVVPAEDGHTAYVTDSESNNLLVVDYVQGKILNTIAVGSYPHGLRLSPDGKWLAIANIQDKTMSLVDVAAGKEKAKIRAGKRPIQVAFSPDGHHVAISLFDESRIGIINIDKARLVKKYNVGNGPAQLCYTPDGKRIVVANQGSKEKPDNRISVVNLDNDKVSFITTGTGAHGVAIAADGTQAFITNSVANTLSVVDLKSESAVRSIPVGEGPNGVAAR